MPARAEVRLGVDRLAVSCDGEMQLSLLSGAHVTGVEPDVVPVARVCCQTGPGQGPVIGGPVNAEVGGQRPCLAAVLEVGLNAVGAGVAPRHGNAPRAAR